MIIIDEAPPQINVSISSAVTIPALAQLTDVNVAGVTDGQLLNYNASTSKWIASDPEVAVPTPNIDGGEFN